MLREISQVSQRPGEPPRRWLTDEQMDLILWYDPPGAIKGLQVRYDKLVAEKAITWSADTGASRDRVDDGEGRPGTHKETPVLTLDEEVPLANLLRRLR